MFAYCLNNPVNGFDPSGTRFQDPNCRSCGGLVEYTDSGTGTRSYSSANEAAIAFSNEIYSSSLYVRIEYSTEIYYREINGIKRYYYTIPAVGTPHSASGIDPNHVPNDGVQVAYAHTHPNSDSFSVPDKRYADNHGIDAYVVTPNLTIQYYNHISGETQPIETASLRPLTQIQKITLLGLRYIWDDHFVNGECPKGFGCENFPWPNE